MRKFFCENVCLGGAIPDLRGLALYLKDFYLADRENLKQGKVALFYDEVFDEQNRFLCAIIFAVISPEISVRLKPLLQIFF